ncbi:hypothetical protein Tco_1549211 [Tanacetum coccineum]
MGVQLKNTMETRLENGYSHINGNGYHSPRHNTYQSIPKVSLQWLDLRVFYIRISKCDIDNESTSEYLTLNHVPLNRDTLLEVNGVRTSIYSDGVSILLKRDRLDKKSEEVTFVSTDSLRTTGSHKCEVYETNDSISKWRMECETDMVVGHGFLKGKHKAGIDVDPPSIEVCLAGSFSGSPMILTKTLHVSCRKKQMRKGVLEAIPENETMVNEEAGSSTSGFALKATDYPSYKPEHEYHSLYTGMEYVEGEDGELSWFNAGVRVGVGIGLSVCLGIGIGVGLLVRTYHGTTRNFTRRLL